MPYEQRTQISATAPQLNANACAGLPVWRQKDCPLANKDLVAWAALGFHHAPIESLPTKSDQLTLKLRHFFNRSLAIDRPA